MKIHHWLLAACMLWLGACGAEPTPAPTIAPTPTLMPDPTPLPGLPVLVVLGEYPLLAPEDVRYDLDEFFHRLETTHPEPYANRSKSEVDAQLQQINASLAGPLNMIEFFRLVDPLVNSLGDGHTFVSLPDETLASIASQELFFPLALALERGRAYVLEDYSPEAALAPGSELLEINGLPFSMLLDEVGRYIPPSGALDGSALWLALGSQQSYSLRLLRPGETDSVSVKLAGVDIQRILERRAATQPARPLAYRQLPGEPVGLLTLWSFEGTGALAKPAFVQMQKNGVNTLIIDIRENSGGPYDQVQALMDYLTGEPYRLCSTSTQAPFGGYGSGELRQAECEQITPFPVEQRFNGKIYLLVGPDTFSAGVTFATILQDFGLATLAGAETRAPASYCADVQTELGVLPRTGLRYQLPLTCYVRPSGVLDGQGVLPDLPVETNLAARIAGEDPVLEAVLDRIRQETAAP